MSLLEKYKNRKMNKRVAFLKKIQYKNETKNKELKIKQQEREEKIKLEKAKEEEERSRMYNIEKVREEEKKEKDNIVAVTEERQRVMEKKPEEDTEYKTASKHKTLTQLINGFLTTTKEEREKFINMNSDSFKSLKPNEQQTLYTLYFRYL